MPDSVTITKPWGSEEILTPTNSPYTVKILYFTGGNRWSLQYHDQKTETLVLISGQVNITQGSDRNNLITIEMKPLTNYTIPVNQIHRLEAVTDSIIFEASTPETGTTYRLEDDYNRPDETDQLRNSPNRGWDIKK